MSCVSTLSFAKSRPTLWGFSLLGFLMFGFLVMANGTTVAQQSAEEVIEPGIQLHNAGERVVPGSVVEVPVIRTLEGVPAEMPTLEHPKAKPKVRNLILMIGDGMGPQQLGLLSLFAHYSKHSPYADQKAAIERLMNEGVVGLVRTEPHGSLVVDSAAAATQLATGQFAGSEMIGTNFEGESAETVLEAAKQSGRATGLVSDTRLTHATPAAFGAHQRHREMENEIAVDLLENQIDVMLSGGLRNWIPEAAKDDQSITYAAVLQMTGGRFPVSSKRQDNRNLLLEAREDYQLVFDRTGLERLTEGRVLGLFADSGMDDALMERAAEAAGNRTQPSLVEMTEKAVELLDQDPDGFFLMVEGGQIDWAGHNNDAGTMLHELLRFDAAVAAVLEWAKDRDDTLVIVTADHETGSFGFSYSGKPLPQARRLQGSVFQGENFEPNFNFAGHKALERLYGQKESFYSIFLTYDALPEKEKTLEKLVELVNAAMPIKIDLDDAVQILTRERNPMYAEGHPYLGTKTVPKINDFPMFFVYGENSRHNLLGRMLAEEQNVVWGTGTHTSTPSPLGAWGPEDAAKRFGGLRHATEIGRGMMELMRE